MRPENKLTRFDSLFSKDDITFFIQQGVSSFSLDFNPLSPLFCPLKLAKDILQVKWPFGVGWTLLFGQEKMAHMEYLISEIRKVAINIPLSVQINEGNLDLIEILKFYGNRPQNELFSELIIETAHPFEICKMIHSEIMNESGKKVALQMHAKEIAIQTMKSAEFIKLMNYQEGNLYIKHSTSEIRPLSILDFISKKVHCVPLSIDFFNLERLTKREETLNFAQRVM